jgi:hypothetical protein
MFALKAARLLPSRGAKLMKLAGRLIRCGCSAMLCLPSL